MHATLSKDWLARNQDTMSIGATCLSVDCCFSELPLKNPTKRVGIIQSGPHHHVVEN